MIADVMARTIASQWHGGGGSALYALCSTGAIDTARWNHNVRRELTETKAKLKPSYGYSHHEFVNDVKDLNNLEEYVLANGPRDPIEGWGDLSW